MFPGSELFLFQTAIESRVDAEMNRKLDHIELGIGVMGLVFGLIWLLMGTGARSLSLSTLFQWTGIMLLGQELARDMIWLLFFRGWVRRQSVCCRGRWRICAPTVIGVGFVVLFAFMIFFGRRVPLSWSPGVYVFWFSGWWLTGYGIRHLVLELRREVQPH